MKKNAIQTTLHSRRRSTPLTIKREFLMSANRPILLFSVIVIGGCSFNDTVTDPVSSETYSKWAYLAGRSEARRDLQRGHLVTESAGLPLEWTEEYIQLLRQRYGIEDRTLAGCVIDDKITGHIRGYNEVSQVEITRRFGSDVFDRTAKEAQAIYKRNYPHGRYRVSP